MEERRFDTYIFDLDGTLLDTVPDLALLTNRILREMGAPEHTTEEILSYVGSGVRRLIYLAMPKDSTEAELDEAMGLWNKYFMDYYENTFPYPGIEKMLGDLREKGCKIGVVSNKLQPGVDVIMSRVLPDAVDVMYGESPSIPRKPDPTGIQQAMKVLGAQPERTIYVGDSPNDIVAGKNAGTATAAVLWGYHQKQDFIDAGAIPDYFVEKPEELVALSV